MKFYVSRRVLFCFSFFLFFCRVKFPVLVPPQQNFAFIGLVIQGYRRVGLGRCEAGPAAPKPMAPGNNDATFLWRHAVDQSSAQTSTALGGVVTPARPCLNGSAIPGHFSQTLEVGEWMFFSLWKEGRLRVRLCRLLLAAPLV